MNEPLYFEEYGQPGSPVIVFLHGLLGSSRNWRSIGKALSARFHVYALDLPEHGESPHTQQTSLVRMAGQVGDWITQNIPGNYILCGHSLGGKVAMLHACTHPKNVLGLVVVDIAPRDYPPEHHLPTLDALLSLDLSSMSSRKQADEALAEKVPHWAFRQFLLTNLKENDGFGSGGQILLPSASPSLNCPVTLYKQGITMMSPAYLCVGGSPGMCAANTFLWLLRLSLEPISLRCPGLGTMCM